MKLNRNKLRKLIFEVLNENESPDQNIAIGDALYKHFRSKVPKKYVNSKSFGFRQNPNINSKLILDTKGSKEFSSALKGKNITYVYGFFRATLVEFMSGGEVKAQDGKAVKAFLQKEVDNIANQYNVNIKIGHTSPNTRYSAGADGVVFTINRIEE